MQAYLDTTMRLSLVAMLVASMSSCTRTAGLETTIVVTGCHAFQKIYPSRADTTETKRQILAHNLTHQEICDEIDKKTP